MEEIVRSVNDPRKYSEIIFYSFGEASLRLYDMLAAACELHTRGARVRVNTDGYANAVYQRDVTPDFEDNVDALSIALIAQDAETYNRYCQPKIANAFDAMLNFTRRAKEFVPDITMAVIDGLPGVDTSACRQIADDLEVKFSSQPFNILQHISQI